MRIFENKRIQRENYQISKKIWVKMTSVYWKTKSIDENSKKDSEKEISNQ